MVNITITTAAPSADPNDLDFWNYVLYSLELLLNLCFMLAYPVISYICLKQKILHINFRWVTYFTVNDEYHKQQTVSPISL